MIRTGAVPLLQPVLQPVWYGKPMAGTYVRLWQTMAEKYGFEWRLVLGRNGAYIPEKNEFSPGYLKKVSGKKNLKLKSAVQASFHAHTLPTSFVLHEILLDGRSQHVSILFRQKA